MAYSLVGRSAPMAADDSDDDDQWQDGGEDDVRVRVHEGRHEDAASHAPVRPVHAYECELRKVLILNACHSFEEDFYRSRLAG